MVAIPFSISSAPGVKPQEGAGRLRNCFAEKLEQGARFPVIWRRCAGLRQAIDISSHDHLRGAIYINGTLLAVMDSRVHAVTRSGVTYSSTNLGALAGTLPVTIARNRAGTPNIVCVTENGAFNLYTGTAPDVFADNDLPQPNSVAEINGYLVFTIGDGRVFATDLNAVTVSTSSFTTAPGPLLRGVTFRGEFFAFGETFIQPYREVGASPFPLEPALQGTVIPRGIVGTHAVAGWEPGWANQLIWATDACTVDRLDGYTPVTVSNDDVTRAIEAAVKAGDGALLEASVYMQGAHAMWRLTYPGNWTWEYNATTGNWHERFSYGRADCRASSAIKAFDRWIVGDRVNGLLYEVAEDYYREGNDPLIMELTSGPVAQFPARIAVFGLHFDFTAATGIASGEDPIQTDPKVLIEASMDGGYSYGNPVTRDLGKQGEGGKSVSVNRIGLTKGKGMRVRLRVSDPVHCGFLGGQAIIEQRSP